IGPHTLFQVAVSKLEADFGVIRIEVGDLMKDVEGPFVVTRTSVRVGDDQILGTRVNNQSLTRVEFAKFESDNRIARFDTLDLLEHRNRLQIKFLRTVMFSDALETGDGIFFLAGARV